MGEAIEVVRGVTWVCDVCGGWVYGRQVEVQARRLSNHRSRPRLSRRPHRRFSLSCRSAGLLGRTGRCSVLWQLRRRDKDRLEPGRGTSFAIVDASHMHCLLLPLMTHQPHHTPHSSTGSPHPPHHTNAPKRWVSRRKFCRPAPEQPLPKVIHESLHA